MPTQEEKQTSNDPSTQSTNQVVQWNRILLGIVRTPNTLPVTVHPTRSFAIMHAAIYDAVNAIDQSHKTYSVRVSHASKHASQEAAAAAAGHEVLVALYPKLQPTLDADLQQALTEIGSGDDVNEGVRIGQSVGAQMVALRSHDGSDAPPVPYVFGTAPGNYQSTPPYLP
jgi:hypothetical protein